MYSIHNVVFNVTFRKSEPSSFGLYDVAGYSVITIRYRSTREVRDGPAGFAFWTEKRDLNERLADFLISRKMESFSLHAHPLSRVVIKQIEPLPWRRNKPHRSPLRPSPLSIPSRPSRPLPKSRNLNKFTSVCTRINFTSFLAPLPLSLFLFLSLLSFSSRRLAPCPLLGARKSFRPSPCPCGFSFATVDE